MNMLLRSMLFVPAYNEKFMTKAIDCAADAIIFDMEDAVPVVRKKEARMVLNQYLAAGVFRDRQLFVRVNELGTLDLIEDLKLIQGGEIIGIVTPKINTVSDIEDFSMMLGECEKQGQLPEGSLKLLPLIESASAVMNVQSIAGASKRIAALLFGGEDYLDSIWGRHEYPPKALEVPRAMVAMAARMYGLLPIDTPYLELNNEEGFVQEERVSYAMGYAGILLVNPKQISWANQCFRPSEDEVEEARKILEAVRQEKEAGGSIAMLNGKMIGPPMLKKAQKIIMIDKLIKEKEAKHGING